MKLSPNAKWTFPAAKEVNALRFINIGHVMDDMKTLASYNVQFGHVSHIIKHTTQPSSSPPSPTPSAIPIPSMSNDNRFVRVDGGGGRYRSLAVNDAAGIGEEDWFHLIDREGTSADLMFGFVLGVLLGIFSLLFFCSLTTPRQQKIGILLGLTANVIFGALRVFIIDNDPHYHVNDPLMPMHSNITANMNRTALNNTTSNWLWYGWNALLHSTDSPPVTADVDHNLTANGTRH